MHHATRTRERKAVDKPDGLVVEATGVAVFAVVELALRTNAESNTRHVVPAGLDVDRVMRVT